MKSGEKIKCVPCAMPEGRGYIVFLETDGLNHRKKLLGQVMKRKDDPAAGTWCWSSADGKALGRAATKAAAITLLQRYRW